MPETASKTDNFLKAIEKHAEEQRTKIQSEAESFKENELNKAEEEGLREAYVLIQKEMSDINTEIASELSRAESSSRKKIFVRRQEIEQEVFQDAGKKLLGFTKTDKYVSFLEKSAKAIAALLDADDVVLLIRKEDTKFADRIRKAFGRKCKCEPTDEITFGGMMGMSRSLGRVADETLDSRLQMQHEWFYENSGLKVTG